MKYLVMREPLWGAGVLLLTKDLSSVAVYREVTDVAGTAYWKKGESTDTSGSRYSPYWCLLRFVDWQQADNLPTVEEARAMLGVAE